MRRLVVCIYGLVFVTELGQSAIVPLLPTFARELSLSEVETGALLAATTAMTVLVSVPIGSLADRVGAKRLVIGAAALIAAGTLLQGLGASFAAILLGRALFGVAFATVWTAGTALISAAVPGRTAAALGGTISVGGAAHLVAPTASGFLAEQGGVALPFSIIAGLAGLVAVLIATAPHAPALAVEQRSLRAALAAMSGNAELRTALVVIAVIGLMAGVVPLLAPLILADNSLSAGEIGVVFSAASAVGIVVSVSVARRGGWAARPTVAGLGVLALGAVFLVPVATLATAGIVLFGLLASAVRNVLNTITYPLGEAGARIAGIGAGVAIGLLNVVWGITAAVGPLVGGAIAQSVGYRPTFALVTVCAAIAGASILIGVRVRRAAESGSV